MKPISKLDLEQLEKELISMEYWHPIWKVVKKCGELKGWWKNQPRGNSKLGYQRAKNKSDNKEN